MTLRQSNNHARTTSETRITQAQMELEARDKRLSWFLTGRAAASTAVQEYGSARRSHPARAP